MFSHYSLHNSGKSFFNISMTLALERGRLTHYRYCTRFGDEPWYDDQCIAYSSV